MYMFDAASALYQLLAMKALAKEEAVESLSYNALQSCQTPHKSGPPERKQSYAKIQYGSLFMSSIENHS